ncbi:MAG: hypothetical protein COB02_18390, partial [Candidatus Cloacimonadota bacterium]
MTDFYLANFINPKDDKQADYHPSWILDEVAKIVPFFAGVSWDKLGKNGMQWPVSKDGTESTVLHQQSFKRGLGHFEFHPFVESNE